MSDNRWQLRLRPVPTRGALQRFSDTYLDLGEGPPERVVGRRTEEEAERREEEEICFGFEPLS